MASHVASTRLAISAPRPSERPKLGHDLREIHSTDWSEPHLTPTARDPELKHNLKFSRRRLVMFMDAISHVARITRVLRQPKGNMLLLGVGGSGRQSLSRLSTFMAECKIFSIEITKGYGLSEWC